MKYVLYDDDHTEGLYPLTLTRPASDLRCGIETLREKWERILSVSVEVLPSLHLKDILGTYSGGEAVFINSRVIPTEELSNKISQLEADSKLTSKDITVAFIGESTENNLPTPPENSIETEADFISRPYDLFRINGEQIRADFDRITKGRASAPVSASNQVLGSGDIFLEEGAVVEGAILNASNGPIYIGKNAEIMEGSIVRGGLAMCEGAVLKLGAKIYGPTTVGPYSKVGGEVNNSILIGYSNKGHDGFLGNSVIGEWCNLGADTNTSNLKNNYAEVRIWDYRTKRFAPTGLQFCGLIMGDHSKCGINTMFNTGTVIGVSANIFGSGFPRTYIPSFAWGGSAGFSTYQLKKAFEVADVVMGRRSVELSEKDRTVLEKVFELTAEFRYWEEKNLNT